MILLIDQSWWNVLGGMLFLLVIGVVFWCIYDAHKEMTLNEQSPDVGPIYGKVLPQVSVELSDCYSRRRNVS